MKRQSPQPAAKPRILLIGPPNVGKSALFNRLTNMNVSVANYTGTTVEFSACDIEMGGRTVQLIDVPGTYTLDSANEAEKVAVDMLHEKPDAVICTLDANNLEPSLYLLLQILEYRIPTAAVVNRWDLARRKGIYLDLEGLSHSLNIPVLPTIAVENQGLAELRRQLGRFLDGESNLQEPRQLSDDERWQLVDDLLGSLVRDDGLRSPDSDSWGTKLVRPWPGIPLAMAVIAAVFAIVIGVGMGLRQILLLPLFRGIVQPAIEGIVDTLVAPGIVHRILIGEYGFLIKGIEWPFTLVFPYVFSFYLALSFLEDTGYLPRLGVLLDGLLHKIGLQGSSIIPLLLGYGCGIPGILATRALGSRKERLLVSALICLAVPCISQTGAFISLLSAHSVGLVISTFLVSVVALIAGGLVLDRVLVDNRSFTLMEVPDLLLPKPAILGKKVWVRLRNYVFDGALPMFWAIGVAAVLYESGLMAYWGRLIAPIVTGWLNLPEAAAVPLALGILRRELTVLPLLDMNLSTLQLFTGAIVALFYVPCIAMVGTLSREFKLGIALGILGFTTFAALFLGGLAAQIGRLLGF